MAKKRIEESLQHIGFSDKEARLYLMLLNRGIVQASTLAHALDFPKTSTRDMLDDLAKRGFILRHKKKNSYYYSADVARLHSAISKEKATILEREKMVEELMPELSKMEGLESKRPKIEYLEGREALEEAFEDFLRTKPKEVLGYGNSEFNLSVDKLFPQFYDRRAKARIPWRGLIPATSISLEDTLKNDQKHLRQSIYFEPDYFASPEINVYANSVSIVSFKEKFLVRIKSREIAKAFRNVLELAIKGANETNARIREEIEKNGLKQYLKDHKDEIEKALREE